jgi:hypothetical protein
MRKAFAYFFALLALLTAASHALDVSGHVLLPPIEHIARVVFAFTSAITALYLFRPRAAWEDSMVCPSCRQSAGVIPCTLGQPHPRLILVLLGGIIFSILIQLSSRSRFRCAGCSAESSRRTFCSWLALAWCFVIVLLIATALVLE